MSNKAKLIIDDEEMGDMNSVAYESSEESISIFFTEKKGFTLSILNRETNMMNYYSIVDGKPVLSSRENILTGDESMLRDDIKDRVFDLITTNFTDSKFIVQEHYELWIDLNMDTVDVTELSTFIENEFEIAFVNPDSIQKWTTVKDIVSYIEDALECALHDKEE